ncbi:MAG: glycosyltransferase family 2 protein, partial [Calditrichota bacterium]
MQRISAIIPHAGGRELLTACVDSLSASQAVELETIIVDNGVVSDVDESLRSRAPSVHILRYECNIGFAAACNRGVEAASGDFVFLLNNDAVVDPDCLFKLAQYLTDNPEVAACQPKILSLLKPGWFDYSSAAGGEMDVYGYPFAQGRIFDTVEPDHGQYDDTRYIFWGAGAALMIRRELFLAAGGLTEWFFAHMEEIDLLWRLQLMGYRVAVVGEAKAYHRGAMTIRAGSFRKFYLNHRNSLAMMVRNYSFFSLLKFLPVRLWLDLITLL